MEFLIVDAECRSSNSSMALSIIPAVICEKGSPGILVVALRIGVTKE